MQAELTLGIYKFDLDSTICMIYNKASNIYVYSLKLSRISKQ